MNAGQAAENRACEYIEGMEYEILARNFRTRGGEIDIIARDGDIIAFLEIKYRKNADFGSGADAVTFSKQRKIRRTAEIWLSAAGRENPCRFDVIELYADGTINHIRDAFE